MKFKAALLTLALCSFTMQSRAADAPYIGQYDPETECEAAASDPICAYKTWFYCRISDDTNMCDYIMGKGRELNSQDQPWTFPLTQLMVNTLDVYHYAFIGTKKVTAERFGSNASAAARRLVGTVEVMDTYGDPDHPEIAYIGSEFYTQAESGRWRIVGWTMKVEGGEGDLPCLNQQDAGDDTCKLKVDDIPSWADQLRAGKLK